MQQKVLFPIVILCRVVPGSVKYVEARSVYTYIAYLNGSSLIKSILKNEQDQGHKVNVLKRLHLHVSCILLSLKVIQSAAMVIPFLSERGSMSFADYRIAL